MPRFNEIVIALLIEEMGHTRENAERLVATYPQVVLNGVMGGGDYRATAIALEMKEAEASDAEPVEGGGDDG